jgi:cyclopropane fatty-acyl-phospholipid synthase-like methyltransferase
MGTHHRPPLPAALLDSASAPYRTVSRFAYYFARGKLRGDPAYRAILERGLLLGRRRILDLGAGQCLLAAWLQAAERCCARQAWPRHWPPAPTELSIRGIELMPREVERARRALGSRAEVLQADIRSAEFGSVDAVVMLDVLHYLAAPLHAVVLRRVRAALPAGGVLLLRVGNAGSSARFRYGQCIDKLVMLVRGHGLVSAHCRSTAQWRQLLQECGFESEAIPMSQGTLFANVLLIARAR